MSLSAAVRRAARIAREDGRFAWSLRVLPRPVAVFCLRARLHARASHDAFSLISVTRPEDLLTVLDLARHRTRLVELGTGTGWTAIALAIANPGCQVISLDPTARHERDAYLKLAGPQVTQRVRWIQAPGTDVPELADPVEFLYVDSSHDRAETLEEFRAWRPQLSDGAVVAFDDYNHADYPGVREAVAELGLSGAQIGTLFVHRVS
jgi:predicted O-methyltransferase YrrM